MKLTALLCSALLLTYLTGCGQRTPAPTAEPLPTNMPVLVYPQFTVSGVTRLDSVNLDGVGENDDSVQVIEYRCDSDGQIGAQLLRVELGTGEAFLTRAYDDASNSMRPSLSAGYLTNTGAQSIVLMLTSRTSNYLASDYYVLEIEDNPDARENPDVQEHQLTEVLAVVDGYSQWESPADMYLHIQAAFRIPNPYYEKGGQDETLFRSTVTGLGGLVDLEGTDRLGLNVTTYRSTMEGWRDDDNVLYFNDGVWKVFSQQEHNAGELAAPAAHTPRQSSPSSR